MKQIGSSAGKVCLCVVRFHYKYVGMLDFWKESLGRKLSDCGGSVRVTALPEKTNGKQVTKERVTQTLCVEVTVFDCCPLSG